MVDERRGTCLGLTAIWPLGNAAVASEACVKGHKIVVVCWKVGKLVGFFNMRLEPSPYDMMRVS